jgi:hypothetical protein
MTRTYFFLKISFNFLTFLSGLNWDRSVKMWRATQIGGRGGNQILHSDRVGGRPNSPPSKGGRVEHILRPEGVDVAIVTVSNGTNLDYFIALVHNLYKL